MAQQRAEAQRPMVEPAEFAFNPKTGEVMLPNGSTVKADAPTIVQLATLRAVDGTPLPKLDPAKVPKGWVLKSQAQIAKTIEEI
ncbi:hypothetical protein ACIAN7_19425, partial [Acinetobacter baumannii]|uniref:hypothetical protein n=1 Tax=Acinetobacter baumannii TaxID=470 RepID=UPI0037A13CD6